LTQFDIGGGFPSGREPKGGVVARPSQGVSESLQAPGLSVQPAVSPAANLVGQLLTALGQAGSTANDYSQYKARERHMAKEEDALQQGLASQNGSADLPVIQSEVENGKLRIPDGLKGDEITAWTRDYVASRVHKDMPQAYRDHYVAMLTPSVERALLNRQGEEAKLAGENNISLLPSAVNTAESPQHIKGILDTARTISKQSGLNYTEDQIYAKVVLPAAAVTADAGKDRKRLEMYQSILGERFPDATGKLNRTFADASARNLREDTANADTFTRASFAVDPLAVTKSQVWGFQKLLNEKYPGERRGDAWALPYANQIKGLEDQESNQAQHDYVERERARKTLAENEVSGYLLKDDPAGAMQAIATKAKDMLTDGDSWTIKEIGRVVEWQNARVAAQNKQAETYFRQQALRHASDALGGGTVLDIPAEGYQLERPNGTRLQVSHDEAVARAVDDQFASIESNARSAFDAIKAGPGGDDAEYVKLQASKLATDVDSQKRHFIERTGAPWPEVTNAINGGASLVNLSSLSTQDASGNPVLSRESAMMRHEWNKLAGNKPLQQRLASNDYARTLNEVTDTFKSNVTNGDEPKALMMAFLAINDKDAWRESQSHNFTDKVLDKAMSGVFEDAPNRELLRSEVAKLAKVYMSPAARMEPDKALAAAVSIAKEHYTEINGYVVPKASGQYVSDIIPRLAPELAKQWVKDNPKAGYETGDLTMRPMANDTWMIVDRNGAPVDNHPYDTRELRSKYLKYVSLNPTPQAIPVPESVMKGFIH